MNHTSFFFFFFFFGGGGGGGGLTGGDDECLIFGLVILQELEEASRKPNCKVPSATRQVIPLSYSLMVMYRRK